MNSTARPIALFSLYLSLLLAGGGCALRRAPSTPVPLAPPDSIERLRSDLDRIFADPNFGSAQWGVEIVSLDRGEPIYAVNANRLYLPASNNKLLTSAAALVRLGPDFRYETRIGAAGDLQDGILKGTLYVIGSGDPTLCGRFNGGDPLVSFKEWGEKLREQGILKIDGEIVGDGSAFSPRLFGRGWSWDDLGYGYAAPVSALQFNENVVTLEISPGPRAGDPAVFKQAPPGDYVAVDFQVTTGAASAETDFEVERAESGEGVTLRGTIALGSRPVTRTLAVRNPGMFFLQALKGALSSSGIDVRSCRLRMLPAGSALPENLRPLHTHRSPPLAEILRPLLKISQNLYSETLVRTLGWTERREGSFDRGRDVVEEVLGAMAIEKGTYRYADGSGLSRLNMVSADLLVRILKYMHRHRSFPVFYEALPIAGVDGTIAGRMKGGKAEKNVHAKTGTIMSVRALSGYVRTADGELLAFSMLANNFLVSNAAAEFVQDAALERLANFSRK